MDAVTDYHNIANSINAKFVNVSSSIPPLDTKIGCLLLIPSRKPPLHLQPWDAYAELNKIKPSKACGPDGTCISTKLIREFAYELSIPLTDILNCSYTEGIVPDQWKKDIFAPVIETFWF